MTRLAAAVLVMLAAPSAVGAQASATDVPASGADVARTGSEASPAGMDTLTLGGAHARAERADPRARQLALHQAAAGARIASLEGRWLPRLTLGAEASYQSEVPEALESGAAGAPSALAVPVPPRDRYEVAVEAHQLLYDGGEVGRRKAVERARLAERSAATRVALHELRAEVDAAFFATLLQQERREQLQLLLGDLAARRDLVAARVAGGAEVGAELDAVEAEILRARQRLREAEAARRTALERLSLLTGREVGPGTVLTVPALAGGERRAAGADTGSAETGSAARDAAVPWAARPERRQLERSRERLSAEAALAAAEDRPRATAFVRGAFGRPGLDFFDDAFGPYATAGVRLDWSLFDGGASSERARALRTEAEILRTERAALDEALERQLASVRLEIERLEGALDSDDRIVELRERRRRVALRQLEEGVLLPAEYVERRTELFDARLRRRTHRVELARAHARRLLILGRPVPDDGASAALAVSVEPPLDLAPDPSPSDGASRP